MNPSPYEGLTLVTFSDLKLLFLRNLTKIKSVSIYFWLACIFLMLFRGQYYIAESTFKQASRQNEMGLSLKETYQQFFSLSAESSTIAIMQSNEVLKDVIEELGMQAVCNPDFFVVKALKRVRDNLVFEFGGSPPDLDTFVFRNVSYPGEKPLKLFLKLTSPVSYQLFGQDKHILGEGKLEQPFSFPLSIFILANSFPHSSCGENKLALKLSRYNLADIWGTFVEKLLLSHLFFRICKP